MRLVVSWLRDFVDVKASPEEIAETLGLRGFEVASVEPLDAGDAVIDFEVTANRPDCLSVLGLAREVATAYRPSADAPAQATAGAAVPSGESDRIRVTIEDAELVPAVRGRCRRYHGRATPCPRRRGCRRACRRPASVRSAPSSTSRTTCCSSSASRCTRSISTNSPARTIRVRRATKGEDDHGRSTASIASSTTDMLVIADRDRAQAVAGVMGGAAVRGVRVHPRRSSSRARTSSRRRSAARASGWA